LHFVVVLVRGACEGFSGALTIIVRYCGVKSNEFTLGLQDLVQP